MCAQGVEDVELDVDVIVDTLEEYPVQCAILYGSYAHRTATADSDVDIAVAFEDALPETQRLDRRTDLVVDLMEVLDTDGIDVADLDTIRPEIGLQALETGYVLVGDRTTLEEYRDRFEREAPPVKTHEERIHQFDAILDRLEEKV